jgi:hypothetical protein
MIPEFEPNGNLPPSIHFTTWETFVQRFGVNSYRQTLLAGMLDALKNLALSGCQTAYIDGSFVTIKEFPGDYDVCWDIMNVDWTKLDPVFLIFDFGRRDQKAKYKGEFFPANATADSSGTVFLDFFQTDKSTGQPKGIIALDLTRLP